MPYKKLGGFKGLNEFVDKSQLSPEYATSLVNIDVDEVLGRMTMRKGYTKKYSQSFTNIISAYEMKIEESGEVILIVNDNGTLKYFKDGVYVGALSMPSGETIDTGFVNNFFGWRNGIRITTGAGATNYVMWFGYTKRLTSENDGLFGNRLNDSGTYRLLRQQFVPEGVFSNVYRSVKIGEYYFFSFIGSKWIEKRDSSFRLDGYINPGQGAKEGITTSIATDGTYLYATYQETSSGYDYISKIDPDTLEQLNSYNTNAGTGRFLDVAAEATYVYAIKDDLLVQITASTMALNASDAVSTGMTAVECNSSSVFIGEDDGSSRPIVTRRLSGTIGTIDTSSSWISSAGGDDIFDFYINSTNLYFTIRKSSSIPYSFETWVWKMTDLTDMSAGHTSDALYDDVSVLVDVGSTAPDVIRYNLGVLVTLANANVKPFLFGLNTVKSGLSSSLDFGTYFYKVSVIDVNGQEFTLSDPVIVNVTTATNLLRFDITCMSSEVPYFYRVKSFNVYRAYHSSNDKAEPATNYKLLRTVDINDSNPSWPLLAGSWSYDSYTGNYTYSFYDDTPEAEISNTTYQENSGISENVKPRFVNGKYMTWLDRQLYLANFYTDGDAYPNQVVRSPINQPDNLALYDTFKYQEDGGDDILGITNMYGRAVVFKPRRVGVFYNGNLENEYFPGVSSDKGYVKWNDEIYYMNVNGVYYLSGNTHKRISDQVKNTLYGLSSYAGNAVLGFFDNKDRLALSYPGYNTFIYNRKYDIWTIYDSNWSFNGFLKNISDQYLAWGTIIGGSSDYIFLLFEGNFDELNQPIAIKYTSPILSLEGLDGFDSEITQIQLRSHAGVSIPYVCDMYIYKYIPGATRQQLAKIDITTGSATSYGNKTYFLNDVWAENIEIEIVGDGLSELYIHSFTIKFNTIGETVE